MNGVINIIKPPSISSAGAVAKIKYLIKEKVGHAGTLDPQAAGVLPVMVGRATKLFDYISQDYKSYIAEIAFGAETDTQDATGKIINSNHKVPTEEELKANIQNFIGNIKQMPPMYSALKKDGERLYALARKGEVVETKPREIEVYQIELIDRISDFSFLLKIDCGKGTYIRTLCHDIAKSLGMLGHTRFLLRERVGYFTLKNAITIEELEKAVVNKEDVEKLCIQPDVFLRHIKKLNVKPAAKIRLYNGAELNIEDIENKEPIENGLFRLYLYDSFICISEYKEGKIRLKTMYKTMQA